MELDMNFLDPKWKTHIEILDERRNIAISATSKEMMALCAEHFISCCDAAIARWGNFAVALSGGSTPKQLYELLTSDAYCHRIQWQKLLLFWSDERAVPPDHPDSNYRMAIESGFGKVSIPAKQIFRMIAENDIEENAARYEATFLKNVPSGVFDLVMLGMGEDGHTASLFPNTHALNCSGKRVVANYVPHLRSWRMTLTFDAINQARETVIYVAGSSKAEKIRKVLAIPPEGELLPIERVGTAEHPALWILDADAAKLLAIC